MYKLTRFVQIPEKMKTPPYHGKTPKRGRVWKIPYVAVRHYITVKDGLTWVEAKAERAAIAAQAHASKQIVPLMFIVPMRLVEND